MTVNRKWALVGGIAAVTVLVLWVVSPGPEPKTSAAEEPVAASESKSVRPSLRTDSRTTGQRGDDAAEIAPEAEDEAPSEESAPKTPEELKEAAEEAAVDAFDAQTDKWMEPSKKGIELADISAFVSLFAKVPAARKEECLQRALNLIPDENVMLLAGVLMDKSQPKELVELVFNDILNRDEDVKKPILQQIFKDKTHPCWADTAWILDVTGEKNP